MTTIAATANGMRPVSTAGPRVHELAARERGQQLSQGQIAAVAVAAALGVVVASYGVVGSYLSICDLAVRHGVPMAELVLAGVDGGLVAESCWTSC